VALCRFWFFCCWVSVLFLGGRRDCEVAEPVLVAGVVLLVCADAVGDGVDDMLSTDSIRILSGQGQRVIWF
jgi:hypothetical protein